MAKARIDMTCPTCGRTFRWETTHTNRKRACAWEQWANEQERECPECYAETMRKKREADAQEALKKAQTNPFEIDIDALDLKGSEKQNAWAKKILAQFIADLTKKAPTEKGVEEIGNILRNTTAREVIDNRDYMMLWLKERIRKARETPVEAVEEPADVVTPTHTEESPKTAPKAPTAEWRKVAINAQNICGETDRGVCVQMPHASAHDGFKFWTSKKLMRDGGHSYEYLLSVKTDMTFKLVKNGNGKYNRFKVIAEYEITADELAEAFRGYVHEVSNTYHEQADFDREEIVRHTPQPLTPIEDAEADPELVR